MEDFARFEERKVVKVAQCEVGPQEPFYLDNEDGSGWAKVTEGYGSAQWPHREIPVNEPAND